MEIVLVLLVVYIFFFLVDRSYDNKRREDDRNYIYLLNGKRKYLGD